MAPGVLVDTRDHAIQAFLWGDYTVYPDCIYTNKVVSLCGTPENLTVGKEVSVRVLTESEDFGRHAIFLNGAWREARPMRESSVICRQANLYLLHSVLDNALGRLSGR